MKPNQNPWLLVGARGGRALLSSSLTEEDESQFVDDGVYRPVAVGTEMTVYDERPVVFRKLVNRSAP